MTNNTEKNSSENQNPNLLMASIGALGFLILLALISTLVYQVDAIEEALEDRLAYQPPVATATTMSDAQPVYTTEHAHTIYVPVYSHIYAMGGTPVLLETTLSIRNTDPDRSIVITSINYFDTKGNKIDEYIDGKLELGPLESSEVLVKNIDTRGGSGANFLVTWNARTPVHLPVVQAVMIGSEGGLDVSFRSNGQPLTSRIDPIVHE